MKQRARLVQQHVTTYHARAHSLTPAHEMTHISPPHTCTIVARAPEAYLAARLDGLPSLRIVLKQRLHDLVSGV